MVRKGVLEVQLIHAETMTAFQEHEGAVVPREAAEEEDDDDDHTTTMTYVEVEPNAQYWIRLESHLLPTTATAAAEPSSSSQSRRWASAVQPPVVGHCEIEVDGRNLGYHIYLQGNERQDVGIWSRQRRQETHRALKFAPLYKKQSEDEDDDEEEDERKKKRTRTTTTTVSTTRSSNREPPQQPPSFWMGTMRISLYQANPVRGTPMNTCKDFKNYWDGGRVPKNNIPQDVLVEEQEEIPKTTTKVVSSKAGTTTIVHHQQQQTTTYTRGKLLQRIELRYCTTVGLVHAEILPRPEAWEYHRLKHPILPTDPVDPEIANLQPTHIYITKRMGESTVIEDKMCDLYDLTHFKDDDDDDDHDENMNHQEDDATTTRNTGPATRGVRGAPKCDSNVDQEDTTNRNKPGQAIRNVGAPPKCDGNRTNNSSNSIEEDRNKTVRSRPFCDFDHHDDDDVMDDGNDEEDEDEDD